MASYAGEQTEQTNKYDKGKEPLSLKELMAMIFGQNMDECGFPLPGTSDNGADWIDKYVINPASTQNKLICDLPFLKPAVTGIQVTKSKIDGNLTGTLKDKMFKAFAMAIAAKANKDLRENGVIIKGDTVEEEAILFLAAHFLELPVKNPTQEMHSKAEEMMKNINADTLWKEFADEMHEFTPSEAEVKRTSNSSKKPPPKEGKNKHQLHPDLIDALKTYMKTTSLYSQEERITNKDIETYWNALDGSVKNDFLESFSLDKNGKKKVETTKNQSLTEVFNRNLSDEIKTYLDNKNINHDTYKTITESVIKKQDATIETLKEKYKKEFHLSYKQIDDIVSAMDKEGITSKPEKQGQKRTINYNKHGIPKNTVMH